MAVLLILGAVLLVIGVNIEQAGEAGEAGHGAAATEAGTQGEPKADGTDAGDTKSSESSEQSESSPTSEQAGSAEAEGVHAEGLPARLGLEKPLALTATVVVSLALAAAVWWRPVRPVAVVVAVFALAAGVFDVIEISHDVTVDHGGLAVLAGIVAASRVAVIAAAADLWRAPAARTG